MRKRDKQINALLYAIKKYPQIGRTKLMKFVFLVDFVWYNRYGKTLLEDLYIRMPNGPVPSIGFSITNFSNEFFSVEVEEIDPEYRRYKFYPEQKPHMDQFDDEMAEIIDKVIELLEQTTARNVSDLTHQLRLWKLIKDGKNIPVELFKLNEYEIAEIESAQSYLRAVKIVKSIKTEKSHAESKKYFEIPDETTNKDLMALQFVSQEGKEHSKKMAKNR